MNRLIVIGASGHGKVVTDAAKQMGYKDIVFLDDDTSIIECAGFPVVGTSGDLSSLEGDVFAAIGNGFIRQEVMENNEDRTFPTIVHPSAVIADGTVLGAGSVVMAGAVINPGTVIGKGVIVNTSCSIDHDCSIGDFAHISVGSHIAGTVSIGKQTWIGAGAVVSNNITICEGCMIGAGTVVINDINEKGRYVGIPARLLVKEKE